MRGMAANPKRDELKRFVYENQRPGLSRCWEPEEKCGQESIKAHSIPNQRVLDQLAEDGHVVMPKMRQNLDSGPVVLFDKVGRNLATTFTGLCPEHDAAIFRLIDNADIDLGNHEQLFLLAYRAVLREMHAVMQAAIAIQTAYSKKVELGLADGTKPTPDGLRATGGLINAYDFYEYKRQFDSLLLSGSFEGIRYSCFVLPNTPPTVAVSSVFTPVELAQRRMDPERIILTILPQAGDVLVAMSYTESDAEYVRAHLQPLGIAEGHYLKYLISKMILRNCDNFVLKPSYYFGMPEHQRETMRRFYEGTALTDMPGFESEHLFLF